MSAPSRKPEVLAPAGSPAALRAALAAGADAVYFGLQDGFNARARAANFALADLPAVVAQIHRAGARAYLTLNTLVFEPELPALARLLARIAAAGVDALIVQDPAVCLLARAVCPQLELHASTQMTIAEPAAAAFAAGLGIARVVVPRELSVQEIAAFAAGTPLELEVFVHGALCVSWSGQCLTSEAWGGRSANRGQCAQSCRMPYDLVVDGQRRDLGDVRYLLSPKDLAGARAVPELMHLGVHGLKIEGRQKGPQYVQTATAGYRRWVDALAAGGDRAAAERQLADDLLAMSLAYSRGFGDGFLGGSDHQTLVEGRFPKHRGVCIGRVVRVQGGAVVVDRAGAERPWTGDLASRERAAAPHGERSAPLPTTVSAAPLTVRPGLGVVFDQGDPEDGDEPGGPLFAVAEEDGALVLRFGQPGPDLRRVRPGDRVWVTSDPALAAAAERTVQAEEPTGRVPLHLVVTGAAGAPLQVVATGRGLHAAAASREPLQPARGTGLGEALLRDKLGSFGGTPFACSQLDLSGLAPGLHLAPAALKELRRELVVALLPQLERGPERTLAGGPALARVRAALPADSPRPPLPAGPQLLPLVRSDEQLAAVLAAGLPVVELDWMEFTGLGCAFAAARAAGRQVVVATPRIGKPGEAAIDERIHRLQPDGIRVRHLGALMRGLQARQQQPALQLLGDFALNATNALTARHLLGLGLDALTVAHDLDEAQLAALVAASPAARLEVIVHHRIPTFHTEHCVYAHLLGSGRDFKSCGRPCERHGVALRDHQGREHPVLVDVGCRNTVFHHAPQQSAHLVPALLAAGVRRFRVEFVREDAAATAAVLRAWQDLLAGRSGADELQARTGAAPQFGVGAGSMQLLVE